MDPRVYLNLVRRNILILLLIPVLLGAGAYYKSSRDPKIYTASATILLRPNDPNEQLASGNLDTGAVQGLETVARALAAIAAGPNVRDAASKLLGDVSPVEITESVRVIPQGATSSLLVTATTLSPERSLAIVNAVGKAYVEHRRVTAVQGLDRAIKDLDLKITELDDSLTELGRQPDSPVRDAGLTTMQAQFQTLSERRMTLAIDSNLKRGEAEFIPSDKLPEFPVSPHPRNDAVRAAMLGLALAAAIVFLRDYLDTRLRTREEIEQLTGLNALAEIPVERMGSRDPNYVSAIQSPDGALSEAIRSLRVSLRFLGLDTPLKVVLVTSAIPGDGKSTVATNLAVSYAQAGARTLLVSADLRRPRVEQLTAATSGSGLVELLTEMAGDEERRRRGRRSGPTTPEASAERITVPPPPPRRRRTDHSELPASGTVDIMAWCHHDVDNLWVLPAGQPIANPVEILGSPVAKDFFNLARESFDMVIVDSPPVVAVSDVLVMSPIVDGNLLVVSLRHTHRKPVARAMELLRSVQANTIGVVVNRVPRTGGYDNYYGSYSTYGRSSGESKR